MSVLITVRRKDTDNNTGLLRNPATVLEPSPSLEGDPLEYGTDGLSVKQAAGLQALGRREETVDLTHIYVPVVSPIALCMSVCLYVCMYVLSPPLHNDIIWVLTRNIGHSPVHTRCNIGFVLMLGPSLAKARSLRPGGCSVGGFARTLKLARRLRRALGPDSLARTLGPSSVLRSDLLSSDARTNLARPKEQGSDLSLVRRSGHLLSSLRFGAFTREHARLVPDSDLSLASTPGSFRTRTFHSRARPARSFSDPEVFPKESALVLNERVTPSLAVLARRWRARTFH
jgi:hypothetical protein